LGIAPPAYLSVSATLLLPIERPRVTPDDLRRAQSEARELTFHPETRLERMKSNVAPPAWAAAVSEKHAAIAAAPTRTTARQRCRTIRRANETMQGWLGDERARIDRECRELAEQLRSEGVLASREFAYCLYPRARLRDFLLEIGPANA
jgi:hypothetical protein